MASPDLDVESFAILWGSLLDGLVVQVALDDPVVDLARARKLALELAYKELALDAARPRPEGANRANGAKGTKRAKAAKKS